MVHSGHLCVLSDHNLTRHDIDDVNMSELYLNGVTVNSTANARRIADVEQCFGSAGQPLAVPGESRSPGVSREKTPHVLCQVEYWWERGC